MTRKVRSIFLSDIHLGTRGCQAERLLEFLREHEAETIFLIGDIVDFWAMSRGIYWSSAQNTVVQKLLRRARHGERVIIIPGNHDEALREYVGATFGDIRVEYEYLHVAADGKRYLLLHGDEFDQVTCHHRWVAIIGDVAYNGLVRINGWLSWIRRRLNRPGYWSLAGYAKRKVKSAVNFIFDFEDSVIHAARERGLDGVICGHIHSAVLREVDGIAYINCGDWVDSCTAIVEHVDGRMELIQQSAVPCHDAVTRIDYPAAPQIEQTGGGEVNNGSDFVAPRGSGRGWSGFARQRTPFDQAR
jgi:UDP-2,3-diacylglucosamine pyrophosphatase LpxH